MQLSLGHYIKPAKMKSIAIRFRYHKRSSIISNDDYTCFSVLLLRYFFFLSYDSNVLDIATRLWAGRSGVTSQAHLHVPMWQSGRGAKLITRFCLMLRLGMHGTTPLFVPPCLDGVHGSSFTFTFLLYIHQ